MTASSGASVSVDWRAAQLRARRDDSEPSTPTTIFSSTFPPLCPETLTMAGADHPNVFIRRCLTWWPR